MENPKQEPVKPKVGDSVYVKDPIKSLICGHDVVVYGVVGVVISPETFKEETGKHLEDMLDGELVEKGEKVCVHITDGSGSAYAIHPLSHLKIYPREIF